jgi:hypothetical protein
MEEFLPALAAVAGGQGGLFTRAQARAAGYDDDDVRRLARRAGPWVVVRRGVYLSRTVWEAVSESERWRYRDHAAHLAMEAPHALSHDSAAAALGIPIVGVTRSLSHITRRGVTGSRTEHGVKHHLGKAQPRDLVIVGGVLVTGPARTSLDLAREHGFATGVVAMDHARRAGATMRAFERELALMSRWPHVRRARAALAFSDPRSESPGESLARILVSELGVGEVDVQTAVPLDGGVGYVDLRVGCHVFEFDGRVKYRLLEHGGVAAVPVEDVVWAEKQRELEIRALGLGVSRIVWRDFWGEARARALLRLRAEYLLTEERHGRTLPPWLLDFARMHPRRAA